jgi:ABC-type branched-subunit amino acid transport system permease subunit
MSNWPLLQLIQKLDGFEFAVFLLSSIVAFFAMGFAVDYILGRRGMGPYFNSVFAALGGYSGLCAHDWWFGSYSAFEPHLTVIMIVGGLLTALLSTTAMVQRWI